MATPNFARCYFGSVYASEAGEDFEVEDTREYLLSLLPGAETAEGWHDVGYGGGKILVTLEKRIGIYTITHDIVAMSGYYGGINYDVVVTVEREGADGYEKYCTAERDNLGHLPATIARAIASRDSVIEKALEKATQKLRVLGVFSNGEAVYEKA